MVSMPGGSSGQERVLFHEMSRLLIVYLAYVGLQIGTSTDPSVRDGWIVYAVLGLLALTGRWTCRVALETGLWLRILAVPALYYHWGFAIDVVAPGLACVMFAYSIWLLEGRRRLTFALPLAVPLLAIVFLKFAAMPLWLPKAVIAAEISGQTDIPPVELPSGWVRYHCIGYSMGIPAGMTSGYLGGERADVFGYHRGRPPGASLVSIALTFPRRTSFDAEPDIREMAGQVFGVATEYEHARNVLNAHDGQMLLMEKLGWIGSRPPERIEEIHMRGASGYMLSYLRSSWYRVRFYLEREGIEHQAEIWLYGDMGTGESRAIPLTREQVLEALGTVRFEPEERQLPTLADCWTLTSEGAHLHANVLINSLLSLNGGNYEALYLLSLNQQHLGLRAKAGEAFRRLENAAATGRVSRATLAGWQVRYGPLGQ